MGEQCKGAKYSNFTKGEKLGVRVRALALRDPLGGRSGLVALVPYIYQYKSIDIKMQPVEKQDN